MIESIVSKFQYFRNRLFQLFSYRAGATMDLIDAVSAMTTADSVVKVSLSDLFSRTYSSITDVLSSLFRTNLKIPPTDEERQKQAFKVTQLVAERCAPSSLEKDPVLFAIDCTANSRIYANKVDDRTNVHAPNHVPGQKPITIGHEYSVLVYLPNRPEDRELHWAVPLSVRRVRSDQSGPQVGLRQLEEIVNRTDFKAHFCISVTDAAYSTKDWVIGVDKWPHVVQIARVRSNRKFFRLPAPNSQTRRGRPQEYGEELVLQAPSEPDLEEITTMITRKGREYQVLLQRWNDVIMRGSKEERTHEHPFDLLKVTVTDKKGIQVLSSIERPSQVQRDYSRIIREIGTPAPFPKPRGKSPGRQLGQKSGERPDRPLIRKSAEKEIMPTSRDLSERQKKLLTRGKPKSQARHPRMRRIWSKNRPIPMRC